jgi:RNA polymerase sigma factor (sigma-70 family)
MVNIHDKKNDQDYILVQNFNRTGDRECFEQLYTKYTDIVFRKCLSYLKNKKDAEDVAQEIWVKVFFALPKFEQKSSFSTWLYRITVNQCINALKKQRIFVSLDLLFDKGFDIKDEGEDIFSMISDKQQVTEVLSILSKDMKAFLLMKYVDEYTYEEIAEATGLGESAIKMRVARAKKQLQAAFSDKVV